MNWLKKKFGRFFYDENDDDLIENDEIYYEDEVNEGNNKRTFRFPIIADEEIDGVKPTNSRNSYDKLSGHANQQHYVPSSEVYDVEVSRIAELLEKRRKGNGKRKGNGIKSQQQRLERRQPLAPKATPIVKVEKKKEEKEQIVPRKKFVPTQVPSPVYGFKKPSSIDELLKKKSALIQEANGETVQIANNTNPKQDHDIPINTNQTNSTSNILLESLKVSEEVASTTVIEEIVVPLPDNEIVQNDREITFSGMYKDIDYEVVSDSKQDEQLNQSFNELTEAPLESSEEDANDLPTFISEMKNVDQSSIGYEDSTNSEIEDESLIIETNTSEFNKEILSHNLKATEEPISEVNTNSETLDVDIKEKEHQDVLNQSGNDSEVSKGSKLPFNVLMLKSDKEKLAKISSYEKNQIIQSASMNITNFDETVTPIVEQESTKTGENVDVSVLFENVVNEVKEGDSSTENSIGSTLPNPTYNEHYEKPSFHYLTPPEEKTEDFEWMESQANVLVEALSHFQVTAQVESIMQGPAVTQFEITVGHGTKVSKIRNLADDLKLALAAKDIRIQAPIPGKSSIGIEIPNRISRAVRLSEVVSSESFEISDSPLEAALGLDLTGKPVTIDLCKMPHGLIAGATGSGKSVCINSILVSLLYKADPHELKLMLIDPKMVELAPFNNIPHLVSPVITDVKTATAALKWAVEEMERRYQLFAHIGVRDLKRYNKQAEENGNKNKLPYILIVIDELADLMMMSPADVEESIIRIAQKARACGIHLILATQRPSVDVITGLIKSNIPTRIAFAVSSQVDSRTILDSQGAERLLGRGDMLYLGNGMSAPTRLQGTFVTDDEIETIVNHVRKQGEPSYMFEHEELLKKSDMSEEVDELFEEVCRFVYEQGTASTSSIQRNYHIGYNRAARLMDMLEKNGFISEQRGSKPREVFITESDLNSMF